MKYFTLTELCHSCVASRLNLKNEPTPQVMHNLMQLVDKVLDPARDVWAHPIIVTSGYRCRRLNEIVGGVPNSQHMEGLAADITTLGNNPQANYQLFSAIRDSPIPYDQLICEGWNAHAKTCKWIHVSYHPRHPRRQVIFKNA